jgi:hypothetical protein
MEINEQHPEHHRPRSEPVAVAVITPSGIFPSADDYRRAYSEETVGELLALAAKALKITNTSDWVANVENRPIDPAQTFAQNDIGPIVEIEWHRAEGGGGA